MHEKTPATLTFLVSVTENETNKLSPTIAKTLKIAF